MDVGGRVPAASTLVTVIPNAGKARGGICCLREKKNLLVLTGWVALTGVWGWAETARCYVVNSRPPLDTNQEREISMSAVSEIIKFKGVIGAPLIVEALGQVGGPEAITEILKFKGVIGAPAIVEALGEAGGEIAINEIVKFKGIIGAPAIVKALGRAGRWQR